MPECYAHDLQECVGKIEDEHYVPRSLQRMLGKVTVNGLAWQKGGSKEMTPSSYAHSRIICSQHHDNLDGLDAIALAYFRNLMLIASGQHVATARPGSLEDVCSVIDGRGLERWFLKTICGAIAGGAIEGVRNVPRKWLEALFLHTGWPEEWALYVALGKHRVLPEHGMLQIEFNWSKSGDLLGAAFNAFSVRSVFSIAVPDGDISSLIRRPKVLGASIERPGNADVLVGALPGRDLRFELRWPDRTIIAHTNTPSPWRTP